jgi:hypothetical protein
MMVALALLCACGPSEHACGCDDVRSDVFACADEVQCGFTKTTEWPGDGTDRVTTYSGDAICVLSALRDRTAGWISLTSRDVGAGTESPGRNARAIDIREDGSFHGYVYASDDAEDLTRMVAGQLREPAFFEECLASDEPWTCIFDYADESTVDTAACN